VARGMKRACTEPYEMHTYINTYTAFWLEIGNERDNVEDTDMDGRLIINLILKAYIQELSYGLISLKIGSISGFVLSSTEIIRMVKSSGLSRTKEDGLCPVSKHCPNLSAFCRYSQS
jgi:hypothetical protein